MSAAKRMNTGDLKDSQIIPPTQRQFTCDLCLEQEAQYACCEGCLMALEKGGKTEDMINDISDEDFKDEATDEEE